MDAATVELSERDRELGRAILLARSEIIPGPDSCWLWRGAKHQRGYGRLRFKGRVWSTHRLAYLLEHGELGHADLILHHCDRPACVRPGHLYAGTHQDNADDRARRALGLERRRRLRA